MEDGGGLVLGQIDGDPICGRLEGAGTGGGGGRIGGGTAGGKDGASESKRNRRKRFGEFHIFCV